MEYFEEIFDLSPDVRTKSWFILKSPLPVLVILGSYLYFIYQCGPRFMSQRPAYNINKLLAIYNIGQVIVCTYVVSQVMIHDIGLLKFWQCKPYEDLHLVNITYIIIFVKLAELIETVFFVLRKKQRQVSRLHVIHHICAVLLVWMFARYLKGGAAIFPIFLNSFVHVVMYTYYLLSSIGPRIQIFIDPYKKYITTMQLTQFFILIVQAITLTAKGCAGPPLITIFYSSVVLLMSVMFYQFYQQSYKEKEKQKLKRKKNLLQ